MHDFWMSGFMKDTQKNATLATSASKSLNIKLTFKILVSKMLNNGQKYFYSNINL